MEPSFLQQLHWRFATKAFDSEKTVNEEDLKKILEAIQMSPSSFGLQPYHIHVIHDKTIQQELRTHSWNQPQVTDASHYLVFSSRSDIMNRINQLMEILTEGNEVKRNELKAYEGMMRGFAEERDPSWIKTWGERQAYIALGFAMAACAELGIDSCPMEGFDPTAYDSILKLPSHMKSVVALAIGYRKEGPHRAKARFSTEDLFSSL